MNRYIDADKIEYEPMLSPRGNGMYEDCEIAHKDQIDDIPTADVVEVVKCKDCKHRIYDGSRDLYYCEMYHGMGDVSDDNYCSFGERAEA